MESGGDRSSEAMRVQFAGADDESALRSALEAEKGVVIVMPFLDHRLAQQSAALLCARAGADGLLLAMRDNRREGFVSVVNRAFGMTDCEYFGYVAQDAFAGRHWLALATATLNRQNKSLLGFNDGKWLGRLAAFGMASTAWARDLYEGPFFYPGYERHYADVELTVLAMSSHAYCYNPHAVVVEVDWQKDKKAVNRADRVLYASRKADGFDGRVQQPDLLEMFS